MQLGKPGCLGIGFPASPFYRVAVKHSSRIWDVAFCRVVVVDGSVHKDGLEGRGDTDSMQEG